MQEATERGASGIAILAVKELTKKIVVERSRKGTGFDYWLGDFDVDGLPFAGLVRLEVSGIMAGTDGQIAARIKNKKKQITPTDAVGPGLIAVVEFTRPLTHVEYK